MGNRPRNAGNGTDLIERRGRHRIDHVLRPRDRVHHPDIGSRYPVNGRRPALEQVDEDRQLLGDKQSRKGDTEDQPVELLPIAGEHPDGYPDHALRTPKLGTICKNRVLGIFTERERLMNGGVHFVKPFSATKRKAVRFQEV